MTLASFQRLTRVLELEEKQGWRNRAVVGGLHRMAERWEPDAIEEKADPRIVRVVIRLLAEYDAAPVPKRQTLCISIRRALAGDDEVLEDAAQQAPASGTARDTARGDTARTDRRAKEARKPRRPAPTDSPIDYGLPTEPEITQETEPATKPRPAPAPPRERPARSSSRRRRDAADLQASPQTLQGVGAATADTLAKLGITQVGDLLWHLPFRYEDFSQLKTIAQLEPGEEVTVIANLWEVRERKLGVNRSMIQGILGDSTGTLRATWWNKWIKNQLTPGVAMRFSGKVGLYMGHKTLENPNFEELDEEMVATGRLAPVYPLTEGLSNKRLRSIIAQALDDYVDAVPDPVPAQLLQDYGLLDLPTALRQAHLPDNAEHLQAALRRLVFDEFLYIQLGVQQRRRDLRSATAPQLVGGEDVAKAFTATLPFALTSAQQRVIDEIVSDLARSVPMTRLVQGDVGSGKTAVAAAAMVVAAHNATQSALLAPTQILAEQHYRGVGSLLAQQTHLDGTPLTVALLTGRVVGSEREEILAGLAAGEIDVVVGTTALVQETVEFANLGFVVVDEQHRFGVEQRGRLRSKGGQPHLLVMSATPIPRSLALTIYGELDISIIDEMPPGRTPIKTALFTPRERERLYAFLRREVQRGRQGYFVFPLVEESEKVDAGAATVEYERLSREVYPDLRLALLHGRMTGAEKDKIMREFAAGEHDILVSTTVIEVGIDVPNASFMVVEDAERFGLAQLHQLRGRVGRGEHASYCALVSSAADSAAQARLHALVETTNGFELAERDLELRGPGDFLGTRQSGLPNLRVAHLGDLETLAMAREAAEKIFADDPELENSPLLKLQVQQVWRGHGDVS